MDSRIRIGSRFTRWCVIDLSPPPFKGGAKAVRCRCDCGIERILRVSQLFAGRSQSCGCYKRELTKKRFFKHGLGYEDYRYRLWRTLMNKCYTKTHRDYPYYGGKGVQVWKPWHTFIRFRDDVDRILGPRPEGLTMDRIDNDGNYEPKNVRWATRQIQALNRRSRWQMMLDKGVPE